MPPPARMFQVEILTELYCKREWPDRCKERLSGASKARLRICDRFDVALEVLAQLPEGFADLIDVRAEVVERLGEDANGLAVIVVESKMKGSMASGAHYGPDARTVVSIASDFFHHHLGVLITSRADHKAIISLPRPTCHICDSMR